MLSERLDRPLPRAGVPAGIPPLVALVARPAHPSNVVVLLTRRGGGTAQLTRATAQAARSMEGAQEFSAPLPPVADGESLDYRAELFRSGQRLATLPADGSWLTVTGEPPPPVPTATDPAPDVGGIGPSYAHEFEFLATFDAGGRVQAIGETPEGYRIDFLVDSGTVRGPRICGEILPGGGDWFCIRPDGVAVLDIRATYRTADGVLTYYRARGLLDLGPEGYALAVAGQLHGTPPCYVTPTFHTAGTAWHWLNRVQGIGVGRVLVNEARVCYDVHVPRVGERID